MRFFYFLPSVLLVSIPVIVLIYLNHVRHHRFRIRYPVANLLSKIPRVRRTRNYTRHIPMILRIVTIVLVVLAAMRPQMGQTKETITTHGVDIILTLDISPSMLAEDFRPNRVDAAKTVLTNFVRRNSNDRIGLVVFSGMAFTQCPLTTDMPILEEFISQVEVGDILRGGTAIGDALVTSVARFPDETVPSRVIILLTDGEHNLGQFDPDTAARIANRVGVRIYTIGVGSKSPTYIPDPNRPGQYLTDEWGRYVQTSLDEDMLRDVARLTGGRYYRATDETALQNIYDEIGQLETHEIESHRYTIYSELFQYFLGLALILLLMELGSRLIFGRVLP